jgi:hypothetical protein
MAPPFSRQALARIKAAESDAGADLLKDLAAFWASVGMSAKALGEHDPWDLMPLFESYAGALFDAKAKELLACFPDPEAYDFRLMCLPMDVVAQIRPDMVMNRQVAAATVKSGGWKALFEALQPPSGAWEAYLDFSFRRHIAKHPSEPERGFQLLFCRKYLIHLRFFENLSRFTERIGLHLSARLPSWRGESYRRIGNTSTVPPTPDAVPNFPQTLPGSDGDASVAAGAASKKRGPKPDRETALRVAEIVATEAPDGDWKRKDKLDEICSALDGKEVPYPRTWPKRDEPLKSWEDAALFKPELAKKAIAHWLKTAKQRKKPLPETVS